MHTWTIHPDYATGETGKVFQTLEKVFSLQGEKVSDGPLGIVLRVPADGSLYYVKLNHRSGKGLRHWLGRSRLRGEWENLQHFVSWGIPTARPVAFGIEKKAGVFKRGSLITAELKDTADLAQMARSGNPCLKNKKWVAGVSRQLATCTRIMHSHRFAHGDLKWRNILSTQGENPQVYLIDCPDGRFWIPPFLQYRKNKDLACLDKIAGRTLSRTQRLRFFMDYLGRQKLNPKDKKQLRHILRFFDGRE